MKIKIGELARMAGCPVVTIRFYEKEGLLKAAERSGGNYRLYGQKDIDRLRFIIHCRRHGITLADIRQLLAFFDEPGKECAFVHNLVQARINYVEEQIASLLKLKEELRALSSKKSCGKKGACAILEQLGKLDNCPYCQKSDAIETGNCSESSPGSDNTHQNVVIGPDAPIGRK